MALKPHEQLELIVDRTVGQSIKYDLDYAGLGLCSEAGEVAGEIKKVLRNDNRLLTEDRKARILDELSDVLWYVQQVANLIDTDLPELIQHLDVKLTGRLEKNQINER
jgi:NTP pyrophosphatase (non-canonical NTP hydrolase)